MATTNGTVGLLQPQPAAGEPGDRRTSRWSTDNLFDDAVTLTTRRGRQSPLTALVQEVQPEVFRRPDGTSAAVGLTCFAPFILDTPL